MFGRHIHGCLTGMCLLVINPNMDWNLGRYLFFIWRETDNRLTSCQCVFQERLFWYNYEVQKPTRCLFLSHWLVHKPCSMFSNTVYFDITMRRTSLHIVYFKPLIGAQTLYFLFGKSPTVVFARNVYLFDTP